MENPDSFFAIHIQVPACSLPKQYLQRGSIGFDSGPQKPRWRRAEAERGAGRGALMPHTRNSGLKIRRLISMSGSDVILLTLALLSQSLTLPTSLPLIDQVCAEAIHAHKSLPRPAGSISRQLRRQRFAMAVRLLRGDMVECRPASASARAI